jgi:hypothetical protein
MELETNPLGILTFIVAPAILTNASTIMALGTSNRFARAIDRGRALSTQIKESEKQSERDYAMRVRQLKYTERRVLYLVRALTCFYVSVGSFAAASLGSLLGAIFVVLDQDMFRPVALVIALGAGVCGICGLVLGSSLLVLESRMATRILAEETEWLRELAEVKS